MESGTKYLRILCFNYKDLIELDTGLELTTDNLMKIIVSEDDVEDGSNSL